MIENKILKSLAEQPKSRKELLSAGIGLESTLDKALTRLIQKGHIFYQIQSRNKQRPKGMKYYVCQPNPKVRVYFLASL